MAVDQLKQINQDENKDIISIQEIKKTLEPGGFLDSNKPAEEYQQNIKILAEELKQTENNEEDDRLIESFKDSINNEIDDIISRGEANEEDILLIKIWKDLLGEGDERVQRLEELINGEKNNIDNQNHEVEIDLKEGNEDNERLIKKYETLNINERKLLNMIFDENDIVGSIDKFLDSQEIIKNGNKIKINILEKKSKNAEIINILNGILLKDSERHEKLKGIVNERTMNMAHNTNYSIADNQKGNIDYYNDEKKMLIQLWANVYYGENLEINGKRGANIRNVDETNEGKTNIYIYQLELKTRKDITDIRKQFSSLLNIPNLDAKFNFVSPEAKENIMREFLEFFLDIRVHGLFFENKIGSSDLERVLTHLINAEICKNVTVYEYYERLEKQYMDDDERAKTKNEKEKLLEEGFITMGEFYRYCADELKKDLINKDKDNVARNKELAEINELNSIFKEFQDTYKNNEMDKIERKEKLGELGKQLLNNPRLDENTRKEIILLIGSEFSEIDNNYNEINVLEGRFPSSYSGPEKILYTPGCNIEIKYSDMHDLYMYNGNGPKPQTLSIYLDGEYLFDGEPRPNGQTWIAHREGYEIYEDNNCLIIRKLGYGSELQNVLGKQIYEEYQVAQKERNIKQEKYEEYNDIIAQIESENLMELVNINEEQKNIINDETGYTERLKKYKDELNAVNNLNHSAGGTAMFRADYGTYETPKKPLEPEYSKFYELKIPGCEGKIVKIEPQELSRINNIIKKYGKDLCFIPTDKSNTKIYNLSLKDLKIVEKDEDGNLHLYEIKNDGNKGNETKSISSEEINDSKDVNNIIMSTIQKSPGLTEAMDTASKIGGEIESMQNLYKKFDRSNNESINRDENGKEISRGLTNDDIKELRLKAYETATFLDKLCEHHNDFVQLRKGIAERYSGKSNINTEHEQAIKGFISNLDFLINATSPGGDISKFCQEMLTSNMAHSNDERLERVGRRFKNNTLKIIGAIAGGVAAVVLAVPSGGCSLLAMAAIMTAGGMAGGFMGHMVHQGARTLYYNYFGTVEIDGKTIQLKYDDPTSLKLAIDGKISRGEYAGELVLNFLIGTATTFGCMAAGQLVGGWISKACETGKHPKLNKILGRFNKNFREINGDPTTEAMFKSAANSVGKNPESMINQFNKRFFYEFADELGDEVFETGFDELSQSYKGSNAGLSMLFNGLAFFATARHCITPGGNMTKMYKENGISIGNIEFNNVTNAMELTLDYDGNYDAIIEYYKKNGYELKNGHLEMKSKDIPGMTNTIKLRKTAVSMEVRSLTSQLCGFGITVDRETGKQYYESAVKLHELEMSGLATVSIDPKTHIATVISGETTLILEHDYFGGQSHKFDVSEPQARSNSKMMDNLTKSSSETQINEEKLESLKGLKEKLENEYKDKTGREIKLTEEQVKAIQGLKEEIQKQYKQATGNDIELTDLQILSIIDAHKMPGELGNVDKNELSAKDHVLEKTIDNGDIRRFLLEAGFCAKSEIDLRDPISIRKKEQIERTMTGNENSGKSIEEIRKEIREAEEELEQAKKEGDKEKIKKAEEKLQGLKENPAITKAKNELDNAIEQTKEGIKTTEDELKLAKEKGDKEKIKKLEKELKNLKNQEKALNDMKTRIEKARSALKEFIDGKLTDNEGKTITTIEKFLELYYISLNESKSVFENGEEVKWKKIDDQLRCTVMKYYYESVMKPLGLTIFADPSLTLENVNEHFVDESHSEGFELNEKDKFSEKKSDRKNMNNKVESAGNTIFEEIAKKEGRMKGESKGNIEQTVLEEIGKLKGTIEGKIAAELRASIQKHAEGKISIEDQAYLFATSMKNMSDYMKAYPNASPEQVFTLMNSNQNKLLHQHLRDLNTITSSDHGIKHVLRGNATLAENMFFQLEEVGEDGKTMRDKLYENNKKDGEDFDQFKARWRVLTRQAIIDHDLGYTHVGNKAFDEAGYGKGYELVTDHPLRSTAWVENNKSFYTILFDESGFNSLMESVPGHSNAQTKNMPKIAEGTANQTEFIWGILSCVDCAGSPGDYKIAHMFAQKEMIGGLFNAYSQLEAGNLEGAKQALTNLRETIEGMQAPGELGLIKESWKKGIDAFLTNKHYENMSAKEMGKALGFHFNKFLGAFGVVTEIDPTTGKVKAEINKETGGFGIEFALSGESFQILAETFGAKVALKSLVGVCDDYKINDKGPTSNFLVFQVDQAIMNWKYDKLQGKEGNLIDYINERLNPSHIELQYFVSDGEGNIKPTGEKTNYQTEMDKFMEKFNKDGRERIEKENKEGREKFGDKRKEHVRNDVTRKNGQFVQDGKVEESRIEFSDQGGGIVIHGPNNVEVTLHFDGNGYEGFNETAGRFMKMNQMIDGHKSSIIEAGETLRKAKESGNAEEIEKAKKELGTYIINASNELKKFGKQYSKQEAGQRITTEQRMSITEDLTKIAKEGDPAKLDINEFIKKMESLRTTYNIMMQTVQSSNPTLNK